MKKRHKLLLVLAILIMIAVPITRNKLKGEYYLANLHSGVILEATPNNRGPLFKHSKILIIDYLPLGATGVVLGETIAQGIQRYQSRPASPQRENRIQALEKQQGFGEPVFWGGPVAQNHLFNVQYQTNTGKVSLNNVNQAEALQNKDTIVALFSGYTGWGENQLANEIRKGRWRIYPASSEQITDLLTSLSAKKIIQTKQHQ